MKMKFNDVEVLSQEEYEAVVKEYNKAVKSLMVECEEYLSNNPKNYIGHKSILHQRMKELLGV